MPLLATTGSPTFSGGACTINSTGSDRVMVPDVTVLNKTQMWFAMNIKPTWSSTDTNERTFFRWGPNTNEELFLQYGPAAGAWACGRDATIGGAGQPADSATHSAGVNIIAIGIWTATDITLFVNGHDPFITASNTKVPALESALVWDIGQRGYSFTGIIDADVNWAAAGLGTLTQAECNTINNTLINTDDPGFNGFPQPLSFYWSGASTTYEGGQVGPVPAPSVFPASRFGPF